MPKVRLSRTQTYRIAVAKGQPSLQGKRCRVLLSSPAEDFELLGGLVVGLSALLLSGPLAMSKVDLPPVRLKPAASRACHCKGYAFPHAPGFGRCKEAKFEADAPEGGIDLQALFTKEGSK
jgi:hypothetical protein